MLSVFITPWMNPTSIQRATSDACASTTRSKNARYGLSAPARRGWWRAIAWSARRRTQRRDRRCAAAYWNVPTRMWLGGDAGEHGAGQQRLARDLLAGRDDGERPRGRDAERVHRLADHVLAQHRPDRGLAVAAARERRAAGALEVQVAPAAVRRRAPRRAAARGRRRAAASSRRTGGPRRPARRASRPRGPALPSEDVDAVGRPQRLGIDAELRARAPR